MMSFAIVGLCVVAFLVIVGGLWFALSHKETGYAGTGMITVALIVIGVLIFLIW